MKYILLIASVYFSTELANAQCPANDSTLMGAGTSNDVFYSFGNKTVANVSNKNWHMAFSVQNSNYAKNNPANGVAVRVNSGGNGTYLKKLPSASPSNWRNIDTTGFYMLPNLLDSDSTWNLSAFTYGYPIISDPFDFVWGKYNQITHNVTGTKVFVLYNPIEGWYKKVFLKECAYDTSWNFIISNLDNTDSFNVKFLKKTYPNKLFVYYNASTNELIDREPLKTDWDLLWTKYVTYVTSPMGNGYYPVTGVLSNPDVITEQNNGRKCNEVWLINRSSKVNPSISAIGYDWKSFTGTSYVVTDTFVYFIKAQNGKTYKMTFKGFAGGSLGKSLFNVYEATTDIKYRDKTNAIVLYPNPSNGFVRIDSYAEILSIYITNMQGQLVSAEIKGDIIDVNNLNIGMYLLTVITLNGVYLNHLIKD